MFSPTFNDGLGMSGGPSAAQALQEPLAVGTRPFGDHLDTAVGEIGGGPGQAQLKGSGTCPPTESHPLYTAADPHGQPDRGAGCVGGGILILALRRHFPHPLIGHGAGSADS